MKLHSQKQRLRVKEKKKKGKICKHVFYSLCLRLKWNADFRLRLGKNYEQTRSQHQQLGYPFGITLPYFGDMPLLLHSATYHFGRYCRPYFFGTFTFLFRNVTRLWLLLFTCCLYDYYIACILYCCLPNAAEPMDSVWLYYVSFNYC